ncbi:MAG TPA: 1-phosphofructokinase family hexose kinase [Thermoflexus sp.]|nr:1-phosphofructokinase family hexose kinase [Thermoflexus sp.]
MWTTPVLTVTLNPAVDRTMTVPGFREGAIHRACEIRYTPGGKGINVSRILRQLGTPSRVFALAAGRIGLLLLDLLRREGLELDFLFLDQGETRINTTILNPHSGLETKINEPGPWVPPDVVEELSQRIMAFTQVGTWVVFSGSLPPGVPEDLYARLIAQVRAREGYAALDTSGPPLRFGLEARPHLIKPNRAEAEELLGQPVRDGRHAALAARQLSRQWGCQVLLSIDRDGAVWSDGHEAWWARVPPVQIRQSVGAGDALLGAFLHYRLHGFSPPEALRFAAALATAVTLSGEVAQFRKDDLESLLTEIDLQFL